VGREKRVRGTKILWGLGEKNARGAPGLIKGKMDLVSEKKGPRKDFETGEELLQGGKGGENEGRKVRQKKVERKRPGRGGRTFATSAVSLGSPFWRKIVGGGDRSLG